MILDMHGEYFLIGLEAGRDDALKVVHTTILRAYSPNSGQPTGTRDIVTIVWIFFRTTAVSMIRRLDTIIQDRVAAPDVYLTQYPTSRR